MNQRRLYRTIESFASDHFKTEKELLKHVLNEIVKDENIDIKGGRIWQYDPQSQSYLLGHQIGVIDRLDRGYRIPVTTYPVFLRVGDQRSLIANETDAYLRKKGIVKYAVTGVGERIAFGDGFLYQYLLAFNSDNLDQSLVPTLNIISVAVSSALSRKKIEQKARMLARDIDKAREIQQSILPPSALRFHQYDIFGISVPDRIVGGDFFDYLFADKEKDRLSLILGDCASKGLRAASQALYVVGGLRMAVSYNSKITTMMSRLNQLLSRTFSEEQFVSMVYAEFFDDRRGLLLYSNAGHNSPILYRPRQQTFEMLEPTGQILGPFPDETYGVENTVLDPGDVLVFYTDGLSEARNGRGGEYGEKRIQQKIVEYSNRSAEEISRALLEDVQKYSRGSEFTDDKTLVVVKRLQGQEHNSRSDL
ncbi:MAG: serine/threonine-protein phosphatase [Ignavibacteriales bacterium]|nr:serine/threonine-protein phosphatase [Ignavibacteriales bacterium]